MNKGYVGKIIQIIALSLMIIEPNFDRAWISMWILGCHLRFWHLEEGISMKEDE